MLEEKNQISKSFFFYMFLPQIKIEEGDGNDFSQTRWISHTKFGKDYISVIQIENYVIIFLFTLHLFFRKF